MTHPCQDFSCWDNVHGECFGGGCKKNPIKNDTADGGEQEDEDAETEQQQQKAT